MRHIVVIGGGIAGLAAAHALRDAGADITVIEGSAQIGGKLRTSPIAGIDVDEGAESFLVRTLDAVSLAGAVGLGDDIVHPATTSASVWARGRLRPLPARTLLGIPSSIGSLPGVLSPLEVMRVALDRVLPSSAIADDVAVGALVRRRIGNAVVDRLVDPLLGGVYAGRADDLSLHATLPALTDAAGSLVAAVRRALPPASDAPVFGSMRGGLQRFADAVAVASGAALLTGRWVRRIERTSGGFRVVHGPTNDEQAIDASAVIVAVPAHVAARLLTAIAPTAAGEIAVIDYASVAIVTTVWRRADVPPLVGSGYLVPAVARRPVKAVTFYSAKWPRAAGPDLVVMRCSIGRAGDVDDLQRDDADLVHMAVDELHATAGLRGQPVETRVSRWGGGLPQYAVGHVARVRRIRAAVAGVPGLAVCGAAYDGVGIPACIRSGQQAAAQLLAAP